MVSTQKRNSELVDILRPDFQARYEPNFAWKSIVSNFMAIPGLRGLWTMSSVGTQTSNSNIPDASGNGRELTNVGQALFSGSAQSLRSFGYFDGTNDYLMRADEAGLDILGTETYINSTFNGLTIGGWFNFSALPFTNIKGIMGKWVDAGNQRSYLLFGVNGFSVPAFIVSANGIASTTVTSTATLTQGTWHFIIGTFNPSTSLDIFVDATQTTLAAGIPASIFNSTSDFNIFAYTNGAASTRCNGYASICFLSCNWLPTFYINALFEQTRALFGK